MSDTDRSEDGDLGDAAPGEGPLEDFAITAGARGYAIGLVLAGLLTAAAFLLPMTGWVWAPALGPALVALALAQIAVHLAFFLHVTTGPNNTNNVLALVFGLLVVGLVVLGSLWIMTHLNHRMMPMDEMMARMR
ncbi:MAG TPA: cytochrome o ubiquinol oxidase subunit IV [Caulobacter sp.]|nr:cytochrome o ubiquinol oxidase subunit IV [Caulobacter sp.]